jgi:hypothetical protein
MANVSVAFSFPSKVLSSLSPSFDFICLLNTVIDAFSAGQRPFKVTFTTDGNELQGISIAATMAQISEESVAPAGIMGFSLDYFQLGC